jgi:hypothetical protein
MSDYRLYLREPDRKTGGPVTNGLLRRLDGRRPRPEGLAAEEQLATEERATLLLHGFNVNRPDGEASLDRLMASLRSRGLVHGAMIAVLWPGDHFLGPLAYSWEGRDADDSAAGLAGVITRVWPVGVQLSFVSHSLGARVVLETVERLRGGPCTVEQVCLMAPAVDDDSLAHPEAYRAAALYSQRVAVLSSRRDMVLALAYPAGDLLQAFAFWRKDDPGWALGFGGPVDAHDAALPVNVIGWPIDKSRRAGHGDYIPAAAGEETAEQRSAVEYAAQVVGGAGAPQYPQK